MAGYWMVRGTAIRDKAALEEYSRLWAPIAERYGAKMIAAGGRHETREGDDRPRVVIIEFPSYDDALACYDDPDYQACLPLVRRAYERDLVIVEGR